MAFETQLKSFAKRHVPSVILRRARVFSNAVLVAGAKRSNVGPGSFLDRSVQVLGWRRVRIGANTVISEGCWLNVNHRGRPGYQIVIGDNAFVGRRNFFSSGLLIRIGDYCLTTADCKFVGSNHIYDDPFVPYISTGTTDSATIVIGANCSFGVGAAVIGHVTVGHGSVIGANAAVTKDIPPFSVVVGNPAQVVRRFDPVLKRWVKTQDLAADREALLPDEAAYLAHLRSQARPIAMPVVAAGRSRGDLP